VGAGVEGGRHLATLHAAKPESRRKKWSTWSYFRSPPLAFQWLNEHLPGFTINLNEPLH